MLFVVALYASLYILLNLSSVQHAVRDIAQTELTKLLGAKVTIGNIAIHPFNEVVATDVSLTGDTNSDTILTVSKLGSSISLYQLIKNQRIVLTYAELIGLDCHISRPTPDGVLNIQPIIDALSKKDEKKEPSKFDLKIYNVVIRKSAISYDVESEPERQHFDKSHIAVSNMKADIVIPRLSNNNFIVDIKRLSLIERSGLELKRMSAGINVSDSIIAIENLLVELPHSMIAPNDIKVPINGLASLKSDIATLPIDVSMSNSYITAADFAGLAPQLSNFDERLNITASLNGTLQNLKIPVISVTTDNQRTSLDLSGEVENLSNPKLASYSFPHIDIKASGSEISSILSSIPQLKPSVKSTISNLGSIHVKGSVSGNFSACNIDSRIATDAGSIGISAVASHDTISSANKINAHIQSESINVGQIINRPDIITTAGFDIAFDGTEHHKQIVGKGEGTISHLTVKNYTYNDIALSIDIDGNTYIGNIDINDENVDMSALASITLDNNEKQIDATLEVPFINLSQLNLTDKFKDYTLSFMSDINFAGSDIDDTTGSIRIDNFAFTDSIGNGVALDYLKIESLRDSIARSITVTSDIINGNITGDFNFQAMKQYATNVAAKIFPSIIEADDSHISTDNTFSYQFRVEANNDILDLLKSPVRLLYPVDINGNVDSNTSTGRLLVRAPYLQQKNKVIENSSLDFSFDANRGTSDLLITTKFPVKKGNVDLNATIGAANNCIDSKISWWLDTKRAFNGDVSISTLLSRNADNKIVADVALNPTDVVVNDTIWKIMPAKINVDGRTITVDDFEARCDNQFIKIDGIASDNPDDELLVELNEIDLDFIFETLAISNVAFGGRATGKFSASSLFSKIPMLSTPNLHVENFAYNNTVLGNTDIESHWDNDTKGIAMNADIAQADGLHSFVKGAIYPTMDSLYLDFDVKRTNVKFLQPYMSAFTSYIDGVASGHGTLFGNFKRINFMGDVYAEDFKIKIDFLNTVYSCTDSIHIVPDLIKLDGITITDKYGNTAKLGGYVSHEAFHNAAFNISVTDAHNLLCYDTNEHINPIWYGTIYGNGSAFVVGEPGRLDIDVSMSSAQGSRFTFVMSDSEAAGEYNFITFTDRNKKEELEVDTVPEMVKKLREKKKDDNSMPTRMNITLQAEINPQLQMVLVMDPVGGDKIKATGNGNLRMAYNSTDEALSMLGKYVLEKGSYNFTLQDIIIKDFTIREGSAITFNGDPYSAVLDISAIYQLNASLTDLDESFAFDKDLNRTNVPVQAVLNATGEISQPNISFDLAFPTLTQDAYRKVKSIVSTEDMMNRQIIYLVALNRFYTPEYMGNTNKNNEFANVASSTISSQLSSMLGQISDNWSIAPNFRTNKGDFSDVEVDVALSSQLLNNRLLFNGNFGYRDNSMNANSSNFIGDFDIEYLLTSNGNIRLKAYNHYNDQNYYVKSALTTQGVGVVFKYDFDKLFDFRKKKQSYLLKPLNSDSIAAPIDSLPQPNHQ